MQVPSIHRLNPIITLALFPLFGSQMSKIYDDDIAKIPIPILDGEIQKDIAEKVQNSFALRRQSKQLLEYAKQAVEMAIEQGEDAALVWLKERSGE